MKKKAAFLICMLIALTAGLLYAEDTSFRCGNDLIELGYTTYQVQDSCGEPDSKDVIGEAGAPRIHKANPDDSQGALYITQWTYKKDSGIYILTFEGSRLIRKEYKNLDD